MSDSEREDLEHPLAAKWSETIAKLFDGRQKLQISKVIDRLSKMGVTEGQMDGVIEMLENQPEITTDEDMVFHLNTGHFLKTKENRAVEWVDASKHLPDDDMTVLVALEEGEVWTGFMDAGIWRYVSADEIAEAVTHWAEFPEAPERNA